jgi:hypothetical protein
MNLVLIMAYILWLKTCLITVLFLFREYSLRLGEPCPHLGFRANTYAKLIEIIHFERENHEGY